MKKAGVLGLAGLVFSAGLILGTQMTTTSAQSGRTVISPETYPYFGFPYSPGILVGDTLYISGHLGRDPQTTELVEGGIQAETRQAMANIQAVLSAAGMTLQDVVTVTAFITDVNDFPQFNEVYREYFPTDPPARATVEVAALNVGAVVELQMIAVRP
ncbi:MAG: Rid family detoxifying hydrolase [Rhodospirillaceae bacterium]|nr:Rid family detoxifying hydrolase [Rhodospirillaceae bacterium]